MFNEADTKRNVHVERGRPTEVRTRWRVKRVITLLGIFRVVTVTGFQQIAINLFRLFVVFL